MQQLHGAKGHQRGLLGRLCDHAVARRQRGGHLPGENGQRKIPRRDADEGPAATQQQLIALAGGARQLQRRAKILLRAGGVVAQEVHGLAHLGQRIGNGLARLADAQRHQLAAMGFEPIGGTAQAGRACCRGCGIPGGKARCGAVERRLRDAGSGNSIDFRDGANDLLAPRGIGNSATRARKRIPGHQRLGHMCPGAQGVCLAPELLQHLRVGQIQSHGIHALLAKQAGWIRYQGVGNPGRLFHLRNRIAGDIRHRQALIDNAIDERGIGAVFQQSPHQVGQQLGMRTHGRVDAAGRSRRLPLHQLLVKIMPHAMQALELEGSRISLGQGQHIGHGVRIVGGELRMNQRGVRFHQPARAGQIRNIRIYLAGEHRIGGVVPAPARA